VIVPREEHVARSTTSHEPENTECAVKYWLLSGMLLLPAAALAKASDPPVAAPNGCTADLRVQTDA